MITRFELAHLLRDLRAGRIHDYMYSRARTPLRGLEKIARRLFCLLRGHSFPAGKHGEYREMTWKHFCVVCFREQYWSDDCS